MNRRVGPPPEEIRSRFTYDPATGIFIRLSTGKPVTSLNAQGRVQVFDLGRMYSASKLAWWWIYGERSEGMEFVIDHRDTVVTHNWIDNLRKTDQSGNGANARRSRRNSTGFKGVYAHSKNPAFVAQIGKGRRRRYLGSFKTAEEAHAAYQEAARVAHGEFARFE